MLRLGQHVMECVADTENCEGVVCRDGAVCVQGRCQCDKTKSHCGDDDVDDNTVCTSDDGSCDVRSSPTGQ